MKKDFEDLLEEAYWNYSNALDKKKILNSRDDFKGTLRYFVNQYRELNYDEYEVFIHNMNGMLNECVQNICLEKSEKKRLKQYKKFSYHRRYLELLSYIIFFNKSIKNGIFEHFEFLEKKGQLCENDYSLFKKDLKREGIKLQKYKKYDKTWHYISTKWE